MFAQEEWELIMATRVAKGPVHPVAGWTTCPHETEVKHSKLKPFAIHTRI